VFFASVKPDWHLQLPINLNKHSYSSKSVRTCRACKEILIVTPHTINQVNPSFLISDLNFATEPNSSHLKWCLNAGLCYMAWWYKRLKIRITLIMIIKHEIRMGYIKTMLLLRNWWKSASLVWQQKTASISPRDNPRNSSGTDGSL